MLLDTCGVPIADVVGYEADVTWAECVKTVDNQIFQGTKLLYFLWNLGDCCNIIGGRRHFLYSFSSLHNFSSTTVNTSYVSHKIRPRKSLTPLQVWHPSPGEEVFTIWYGLVVLVLVDHLCARHHPIPCQCWSVLAWSHTGAHWTNSILGENLLDSAIQPLMYCKYKTRLTRK